MSFKKTYELFPHVVAFSFFSLPGSYQVGLSRDDDLKNLKSLQGNLTSHSLFYIQFQVFPSLGHDILYFMPFPTAHHSDKMS